MEKTKSRLSRREQIVSLKKREKLKIDNLFQNLKTKERLDKAYSLLIRKDLKMIFSYWSKKKFFKVEGKSLYLKRDKLA